jgi:EAL domain-containing protein (putative c-di-GMP-specific phosphodiesterase class I)
MAAWQSQGLVVPPIAINCSAAQLKRDDFFSVLLQSLNSYDISPNQVELEVTESMLIEDSERCSKLLQQVSRLGVKITIDDFGTGYSSLSYLKDLPFNCIKIDQVFIRDMIEDANHAAITAAIIKMSQTLNLQVVAEGITSHKQLEKLRELGCNIGQGFLFGEAFHADHLAINDEKIKQSLLAEK